MPLDRNIATENLIRNGYSDKDIDTILERVNKQEEGLIRQGKTDQEIDAELGSARFIAPSGQPFQLFQSAEKPKVDFQVTPEAKVAATRAVNPTSAPIASVQPPTTMQNIMSGPVGGAIETGLRMAATPAQAVAKALEPITPWIGLAKGLEGDPQYQNMESINPLTGTAVPGAFEETLGYIEKLSPDFANLLRAATNIAPIHGKMPAPRQALTAAKNLPKDIGRSLLTIEGGDISNAIYPKGTPEIPIKPANQGLGQPQFPITERAGGTGPSISTGERSSIVGQTSTPVENVGKIEQQAPTTPQLIPQLQQTGTPVKTGISTGEVFVPGNVVYNNYWKAYDRVIDYKEIGTGKNKSFEVTVQQIDPRTGEAIGEVRTHATTPRRGDIYYKQPIPTPEVIIEKSATARKVAQEVGNVELQKLATDTINQFGDIKPAEVAVGKLGGKPLETISAADMVEANQSAADLNTILVDKPKLDSIKLVGTAVVDEAGLPKVMYHGTAAVFKKFSVEKSAPGLYGKGLYFTDDPSVAGGKPAEIYVNQLAGIKPTFGYATPTATKDLKRTLDIPNVHAVYLNIKNPFDMDAQIPKAEAARIISIAEELYPSGVGLSENFLKGFDNYSENSGNMVWQHLRSMYNDTDNTILKAAGYDGIKHIGGVISGEKPHQVYIAFNNKQVVSKFDKRLYKDQLLRLNNGDELTSTGYKPQKAVTERQAISNTDLVESEPSTNAEIGMSLVKKARETGETGSPTINDLDYSNISQRIFGPNHLDPDALVTNQRGVPPSDPLQPPSILDAPPEPIAPILRGLPWYGKGRSPVRAFSAMEVESKIPFLTELHNDAQIADAKYTRMMQKNSKELTDTIREVGRYDWKTKKNEAIWDRVSIALEEIDGFNKATGEVSYKDPTTGNVVTGTIAQAARALNESNQDVIKLAGRFRNLYDKYWAEGSTAGAATPNSYLQFYNPHKMTEQQRFDFVKGLRRDEHPFFQYPRSNVMHNYETNALKLINRYISEWARVEHLTPWQKEVAEPILTATKTAYMGSPRAAETFEYARNYVLDKLRMPRDTAVKANSAMFDWVDQTLRGIKPFGNRTADMLIRRFGTDDRLAEGLARGSNNFFINYFQKYRPLPAIRNTMQREFMLPLLPKGNIDLVAGQYKMWRNVDNAQEKFLASGLMPYVEMEHLGTSSLDLFKHAEVGNLSTGFITIHDGIWKDYREGMSHDKIKEKWRVHLYPEPIREAFDDALVNGRIGDIRRLGPNAGNALLGRYATMMTQFPKGPGEVPEYARTGPIAKATWLFSTWTPMSIDYFASLAKDAVTGPKPYIDMYRLGKVFAYLYAADQMWEGFTGKTLASNPITNLPTQPVNAPGPGMLLNAYEAVTGKWNEYLKAIFDEDAKGQKFNKFVADRALGELMRTKPGIATDIKLFGEEEQKQKKRISR